ncbi:LytTR family DNA-binding domain-containing protein [Dyadobacter sp. NIV53]|uniref:LytR/AlgR family response regulator transcription factor n=1 Tax=Dyadobacter sp. NIV53 TaxID=2861765 RepID=UPI001C875630|nr:response regulator [Dyadobacter sp. NIV53]
MKAIIVDDEVMAITLLKIKLSKFPDVHVIAEVSNPRQAAAVIQKYLPDVVFLDIEMRLKDGFEVLQDLFEINFQVVFVTAHNEFTIKAIRANAFDYLLKPVDEDDLKITISRLQQKLSQKIQINYTKELVNLVTTLSNGSIGPSRIAIATTEELTYITLSEVIRFSADGAYTEIYQKDRLKVVSSKPLGHYDYVCENPLFFRVNRSHIINLDCVVRYKRGDGGSAILLDGSDISVSKANKATFLLKVLGKPSFESE